jgi:hypothetical protein
MVEGAFFATHWTRFTAYDDVSNNTIIAKDVSAFGNKQIGFCNIFETDWAFFLVIIVGKFG